MTNRQHHKSDNQKQSQHKRTVKNKINAVRKALRTAGGKAVRMLENRLEFWKSR